MARLLATVLRIGPGEARLAGALVAIMLLTSIGAGAGATAADALLFARFGVETLPQLYLALGIVSFVCALGVSVVFGRARRERVYPVALAVLVVVLVALRLAVLRPSDLAYPLLWLGASVVVTFQGIVGWGVASWLCDARQAKRLFPLANAAKILGVIIGSAAVAPLVLLVRLEDLFILWALTLAATFVIVLRLARAAPAAPVERRAASLRDELLSGFRIVRASPLLGWLAISLVLFSVLFFGLALPFTRAARAAMPREEDLASFLGLFNASTTAVAFLASLFVANRFYARYGVVNAILGFTLIYLAGFVVLVVSDSFLAVAAVRWIQLAWLAGMADAAYQALFKPVPAERRDQMRAFMEGVPGQAGIAIAGVLLLLGDRALDPRAVAIGGVVAAAATTAVIWRTRGAYRDALVTALRSGRPEPFLGAEGSYATLLRDASARRVVVEGLASADVDTRRASAQILSELAPRDARDALLAATGDADATVRAFALEGGARIDATSFAEAARASRDDQDPRVRVAALRVLERDGDDTAAAALRDASAAADGALRLVATRAIAASGMSDAPELLARLSSDRDGAVRREAVAALAVRDVALALAIATRDLGRRTDEALGTLEALPAARTSASLRAFAVAQRERALRYAALAGAVPADGDIRSLLRASLERRVRIAARRAVRGAAIVSGRQASAALLDGLESDDQRRRAEALESLETCVTADLARPLLRIWEGDRDALPLSELREDDDPWLRDCYVALADGGGDMADLETIPLMERVLFLHKVPLFAALDPADLQQVARIATERAFADREVIARQGETGEELYVVMTGSVRVEHDGRPVATRGAGDAIGEMAVVSAMPRSASVIAAGDVRTLRIARADFESILRDRPETALGVIRVLSARLAEAAAAR